MNLLEQIEKKQLENLPKVPEFQAGDTVRVNVRIVEGATERVQAFEGICIAKKNRGLHSSFTVRKISHGEGVERVFPLYSPRLESIEVVRKGDVRRAKLYYLRGRTGKAARIKEKKDFQQAGGQSEAKAARAERRAAKKNEIAEKVKKAS